MQGLVAADRVQALHVVSILKLCSISSVCHTLELKELPQVCPPLLPVADPSRERAQRQACHSQ